MNTMSLVEYCIPARINQGPWLTAFSLPQLQDALQTREAVLPICSLGTPFSEIAELGDLVLPPLYHEALDAPLKEQLLGQIKLCFPYHESDGRRETARPLRIAELPVRRIDPPAAPTIAAFSVDTAVEEHGPHLPLATDRIQSYGVLHELSEMFPQLAAVQPLDYGHLTWGLPFGMSVDTTPDLLTRYVTKYMDAVTGWLNPKAVYVVDVHGSIVHRTAIQEGLRRSQCDLWSFRWLHEPLVSFAGERGDQHAGGVETILVERINSRLVDSTWFPARRDEIAARQMALADAIALSGNLDEFIAHAARHELNGVVGVIENYDRLDKNELWDAMLATATADITRLLEQVE